ncbi:LuxR C-terminal-related transcriptional regulator [Actinophytocola sp. NPDC049390]|uniref:LuxR C-terminal-related transcriptional regulator n=1 Tax=Actinophytocola sp. NPDC049390 TaxID=3363894 RepID=UPI0037A20938
MESTDRGGVLDVLCDLLAECEGGAGGLALVSGGLASGKTDLLRHFQCAAAAGDALLLGAAGSRAERTLQAGVIDQLFHGAGLPPDAADRVARLITSGAFGPDGHGQDVCTIQQASARVVHEITGVVLELSRERSVVVCVDDVQFADSSSLQFLLYLCRRIASARVLVVLTEWEQPQITLPQFHAEISRRPHRRLRLVPLTEPAVADLVASWTDPATAAVLAPVWVEATGGNPMLVDAMAKDLAKGIAADAENAGPAFCRAVVEAVHRWEPHLLDVARAIAALGHGQDTRVVGRLARTTPQTAEHTVEVLTAAGLLVDGRFRHPAAAAAVLEGAPGPERSRLHRDAAELLYRRGAEPAVVARHLVAADRVPEGWSVRLLRIAAEQALVDDATADAVRYLELALTAAEDEQRLAITKVLVRALWRVNPAAVGAHVAPLREAMFAGLLRNQDAVILIRQALWHGDEATVVRAVDVVKSVPGMLDAQSLAELQIICRWFPGIGRAAELAEAVPAGDEDPWVAAARALDTFWTARFGRSGRGRALAAAEHILRSSRPSDTAPEVVTTALLVLALGDEPELAAEWCGRLIAEATEAGVLTWRAVLEVVGADIALRRGDVHAAVDGAERALRLLPHQSWGVSVGYPLSVLLMANVALGRHAVLDDLMRARVPDGTYATVFGLRYLRARGHANLAADRVLAAISEFQACGARMRSWGVDLPVLAPWRSDLAEANLRLGRPDTARELLAEQTALADGRHDREAAHDIDWAPSEMDGCPGEPPLLSDSERRVAELAATGATNREISRRLHITVSTVEQHLTRVYRKLNLKSRADLPHALGAGVLPVQAGQGPQH